METIGHPFRLTVGRAVDNLGVFDQTLGAYTAAGIRIVSASEAIALFKKATAEIEVPDWADVLPDLAFRGGELPTDRIVDRLPAKPSLRNARIALGRGAAALPTRLRAAARRALRAILH